jgi:hypothetical protein
MGGAVRVARVFLRLLFTGRWRMLKHARWLAEYEAQQ